MARPTKVGLDYFSVDIDIFNDEKIEFVSAKFGLAGEAITLRLLSRIYRNGYYIKWDEDTLILFASKLKAPEINDMEQFVANVIEELLKREFFDRIIFNNYGILTSRGIQRRYVKACQDSGRKNFKIKEEFSLLGENYSKLPINSEITPINSEKTGVNSGFSTQTRLEQNRVNKNKLLLEETEINSEKTSSSSGFKTPNFEDKEQTILAITELFAKYTNNPDPDYKAEIEPVFNSIFDKREGLNPKICWGEITESFLIMKRKGKTNSDFLFGIIRNKLNAKFASIQENKTRINQSVSNKIRAETLKEQFESESLHRLELAKKVKEYYEFYQANKKLFTRDEKEKLHRYFDYGMVDKISSIIEPKMEEITL